MKIILIVIGIFILLILAILGLIGGMIFLLKLIFDLIEWNRRRKVRKTPTFIDPWDYDPTPWDRKEGL